MPCPNRLEASELPRPPWDRKPVTGHKSPMPPHDMVAFRTSYGGRKLMWCIGAVVIWPLSLCTVGTWTGGVIPCGDAVGL